MKPSESKIEADQSILLLRRRFMPLPDPIIEVLAAFRPLFTAPTWRKLMILLTGTLLAHGRRTVATALRHTGQERDTNFSGSSMTSSNVPPAWTKVSSMQVSY